MEILSVIVVISIIWTILKVRERLMYNRREKQLDVLRKDYDQAVHFRDADAIEKTGKLYFLKIGRGTISEISQSKIDFAVSYAAYLNLKD